LLLIGRTESGLTNEPIISALVICQLLTAALFAWFLERRSAAGRLTRPIAPTFMQASTHSPIEGSACHAVGIRSVAQRGAISVELGVWVGSGVLAILGLVQAVHSTQPFLWLAVWPAPVGLVCTIFIFLRQGFHFRNGVLVLGRRTPNK
jgi:hypothetical protein